MSFDRAPYLTPHRVTIVYVRKLIGHHADGWRNVESADLLQ
jgi:hypothetical protein